MKRGMRVFVCLVLILAMLLPAIPARAATGQEYGWIVVDYYGFRERRHVLMGQGGTVLAPLNWITYYGGEMKTEDRGDVLVYYREDQSEERKFAKRLFIEPEDRHFIVGIYFDRSDLRYTDREFDSYYVLDHGFFSSMIEHDGELWVPLTELLPLMDVQAAIGDDGYLYMRPVLMTAFRALYEHEGDVTGLLFDAETQIRYKDGMVVGGYAIENLMEFRVDRHVLNWNYGMQNDYEDIFKSYLMDDGVYLETFDPDVDPFGEYIAEFAGGEDTVETVFDIIDSRVDEDGPLSGLYEFAPQDVKDGAKVLKDYGEAVQGLMSLYCYADIYFNHIEDHRRMLDAVYTFDKDIAGKPSGKAAASVSKIYNPDAEDSRALVAEAVRDMTSDIISGKLKESSMSVLGPWFLALEITKVFAYEEIEYVKNASRINLVDNTVSYARSVFAKRLYKGKFSGKELDDIRLSLMMSLIGSRYAYQSYWPGGKKEQLDKIGQILKDLYLAGVFREHDAADSSENLKKKYEKQISKLIVDSPGIYGDLAELEYAHAMLPFEWGMVPSCEWTLADVDQDGVEELIVRGQMQTQTVLGMAQIPFTYLADATSGKSSFHGPILGLIYPEILTGDGSWYLKQDSTWFTWGGLEWKQTEKPENPASVYFDCPQLTDFRKWGEPQELMDKADRITQNRSDCRFALKTDLDGDGDQDLLAVFADPGNRWDSAMSAPGSFGYDVDLRTNGLTSFVVVLRERDGIHVRTNAEFTGECPDSGDILWNAQEQILELGDSLWHYEEQGTPFVPWVPEAPDVTLIDLLGAPRSFVLSVLRDYEEGSDGSYAMGMLGGDSVYVSYETVDGEQVVQDARLDCIERNTYIMDGIPSSMEHLDLWNALDGLATDWSMVEPAYGPNGEIYAYETHFNFLNLENQRMYTVCLLLEDELPDSYIYSIYFMLQPW